MDAINFIRQNDFVFALIFWFGLMLIATGLSLRKKEKIKLCKNCRYSSDVERWDGEHAQCRCPRQPINYNYANGTKNSRWKYCSILREDGWFGSLLMGTCGKRARFYRPRCMYEEQTGLQVRSRK